MGGSYIPPQNPAAGQTFETIGGASQMPATPQEATPGLSWGKSGMTFSSMEPIKQEASSASGGALGGMSEGAKALGEGIGKFIKKKKKANALQAERDATGMDSFEQVYGTNASPED